MAKEWIHKKRCAADLGSSAIVPFVPGESHEDRHSRRWREAMDWEPELTEWCKANEILLQVGEAQKKFHFWIDRATKTIRVEWYPESARVLVNRNYGKMVKAHDWMQVQYILATLKSELAQQRRQDAQQAPQ